MSSPKLPPRVDLALLPTPLLKLERLSARLGIELYVKRDDLTGLLESGNKVRKLEFLVGEALQQGADTLITCGTLQSNCCRAVSAVAARLGLRALLAVKGERPSTYDGNLLLDRLLGAEVVYCSEAEFRQIDRVFDRLVAEVEARGGRPYIIPESGATEVGALGYTACAHELAEQIRHGAPAFDTVVITAFSGGSQAGLLMGKQMSGLSAEVVGIPIAYPADQVRDYVAATIRKAAAGFGLAVEPPKTVHLLDGYQGLGRGQSRDEELATIVSLAREEGIVLDPVYTAKAFLGLLDHLRRDPKEFGSRVCFIHTGGIFSLFPFRDALSRLLDRES
ncbi:MAG: D-cysteine desulfhydrase family protein [Candidatus Rokubacteria bacterium]|nr:D-cysteine desulfhydrase family protein [Candidatus Rokubacteria bacterium]